MLTYICINVVYTEIVLVIAQTCWRENIPQLLLKHYLTEGRLEWTPREQDKKDKNIQVEYSKEI